MPGRVKTVCGAETWRIVRDLKFLFLLKRLLELLNLSQRFIGIPVFPVAAT